MKILHLGTEMQWRGGENQVLLLAKKLNENLVQSYMAFPSASKAIERFQSAGFQTIGLSGKGGYRPLDASKLIKFCEKEAIDIVHTHSGKAHSLGYLMKLMGYKGKLIVHRRVAFPIGNSILTRKKYLSNKVDYFISISEAIEKILMDYGVPQEKIQVARSSVDPKKFEGKNKEACRKDLTLPLERPLIGIVAALTKEKGHSVLFQALLNVKEDFLCLVAGDGDLRGELEELIKSLGLSDKVKFLGFLKDPTSLLKALDILIVPSKNEGLGSVALDGVLAKNLVLASNVGGLPEIILDQKTGFLFEPEDTKKLSQLINENLKKNSSIITEAATKHVQENFSLEKMVEQTLAVYQKVIR